MTSRVTLRGQRSDDWDYLTALFARPEVIAITDELPYLADDVFRERYTGTTPGGHNLIGEISLPSGRKRFVGLARLNVSPQRQRHAGRLLFVPHPDYYGTETEDNFLVQVLQFAAEWLGLQRVEVTVCAEETRAHALYAQHGFASEATMRRYVFLQGAYRDAHVLAWLPNAPAPSAAPVISPPKLPSVDTASVTVRAAEADDTDAVAEVLAAGGALVSPRYVPYRSRASVRQALENPGENQRVLVAELDGALAGVAELRLHEGRRAHSADLTLITAPNADPAVREALLEAALDLGENWLQITRTVTHVYADQDAQAGWWLAHGFALEGTLQQAAYRAGQKVGLHIMARLREEITP